MTSHINSTGEISIWTKIHISGSTVTSNTDDNNKAFCSAHLCIHSPGFVRGFGLPHRLQRRWTWIDSVLQHKYWQCGQMGPGGDERIALTLKSSRTLSTQANFSWNKEFKLGHVSVQINHRVFAGCDSCPATVMNKMNALLLWGT